ncbi:hypothetical protein RJ640_017689 [Escallonia rubra]|uniref:Transmembrane protein n=1 Tax=Escallonia rubra TaxID=112253 RepID=A0AA88QEQ4_9ASTE|nr:hypothetical protein RJ640_017689 [Escallonia rubra]
MSEKGSDSQQEPCSLLPLTILLNSLKIFPRNLQLFSLIFAFTAFPLSLLLFSLSVSSHPIKSEIFHLEALALNIQIRVQATNIRAESHDRHALALLRLRALYFLPCYVLSLLAAITAVSSTVVACSGKRPTVGVAVATTKLTWLRAVVTTICLYVVTTMYVLLSRNLTAFVSEPGLRLVFLLLGASLEVYLMAVTSLALVVSVVEERFGLEAMRVGSELMKGRRVCGWVLSGLFVMVSGVISWELEGTMDVQDLLNVGSRERVVWLWVRMGLICLFGWVVVWSYVVAAVFYCECRRRQPIKEGSDNVF